MLRPGIGCNRRRIGTASHIFFKPTQEHWIKPPLTLLPRGSDDGSRQPFTRISAQRVMLQPTKPVHEFRFGRIKTTVWANHSLSGEVWFNVQFARLYLASGEWQESTSFGRDDLPLIAKAADMAFAWIWSQSGSPNSRRPDSAVVPHSR